jgi:hypothetical protein
MLQSTPTLGTRIDALTSDVAGLFDVFTSQVSSFREAREEATSSPAHNFTRKLVHTIERHPIVSIAAAIGIAMVAARALRRN